MKYPIVYLDPNWQYRVFSKKGEGRSAEHHYSTSPIDEIVSVPVPSLLERNAHVCMWATYPNLREAFHVADEWGLEYATVLFTLVKLNKNWHDTTMRRLVPFLQSYGNEIKWTRGSRQAVYDFFGFLFEYTMSASYFMGLGHYTRANPELCLLFTRGKPLPRASRSVRNLLVAPFERHSAKPDEANRRIDKLWGKRFPKIELYARRVYQPQGTPADMHLYKSGVYPGWLCLGNEIDGLRLEDSIPAVVDGSYFDRTPKTRVFASGKARVYVKELA